MANVKITDLPAAATPLAGTEVFEVVQSGVSSKVAATAIANTFNGTLGVANGGTGATTLTGYVKGSGTSALTASATVPYADLAGRAYISAYSTQDQTGNIATATAVTFNNGATGTGINIVTNTQITFTAAGTYMIAPSIQLNNSDAADHDVTFWFRKNGTDIANSATKVTVPKTGDGGSAFFQIVFYETVTAGQYVEIMWLPENVAVTLEYTAAGAIAPAIASAIVCSERIA
jgi:putative transposon-encoded protein